MHLAIIADSWVLDRNWKLLNSYLEQYRYHKFCSIDFYTAQDNDFATIEEYRDQKLLKEINERNYDGIIVMGNNALVASGLAKKAAGINKFRSRKIDSPHFTCPIYATISVGAVAREPSKATDFENDLTYIKGVLSGENRDELACDIIDITSPEQLREVIKSFYGKHVAYDFETTGLDRSNVEVVVWTACSGKNDEGKYQVYFWAGYDQLNPLYSDEIHAQFLEEFKEFFRNDSITRLAFNHAYDDWVAEEWLGETFRFSEIDVMFEKWAVDTSRPHNLKSSVSKFAGFPNYDAELDEMFKGIKARRARVLCQEDVDCLRLFGYEPEKSKSGRDVWNSKVDKGLAGFALIPMPILHRYACLDAAYTYLLHEIFSEIIEEEGLELSVQLRHYASHECLRAEQRGEVLDVATNRSLSKSLKKICKEVKDNITDHAYKLIGKDDFNPDSTLDVAAALYGQIANVPVINRKRLYRLFERDSVDVFCEQAEQHIYGDYKEVKDLIRANSFDKEIIVNQFLDALVDLGADDQIAEAFEYYVENYDSSTEFTDWLFIDRPIGLSGLELNPPALTKKGAPSCSKASLLALSAKHNEDLIDLILMWRKASKLKKDFIDKIYDCMDSYGLVRTSYNPHGTISGRLSSSGNYNAQNFPKKVRGQIIPRIGYKFLELDLKNAEVFTLAAFSNDQRLFDACMNSDTHRYVASLIFNKAPEDITDDERQVGKTAVFLSVYGGGPEKLAKATRLTVSRATEIQTLFLSVFEEMNAWFVEMRTLAETPPYYVRTAFGTRISTRDILSSDMDIKSHVQRVAVNAPIQGSAGEYCLWLIHEIMTKCRERGWAAPLDSRELADVMFSNTVHDSIRFEVKEDMFWYSGTEDAPVLEGPLITLIKEVLADRAPVFPLCNIQFRADIELNDAWSGKPDLKKALEKDLFRWDLIDENVMDDDVDDADEIVFLT